VLNYPLSGFLGGQREGGYHVQALEAAWQETFGVKYAVSCNSATSGLLMACMAADVGSVRSVVATSPFTMSGTIAPAVLLGASVEFSDIGEDYFCWSSVSEDAEVLITPNIFGHPSVGKPRTFIVIEDNAQAIFSKYRDKYAGTVGHMGVWSLNVHKQIQAGEGGIVTTDSDILAWRLQEARNHGELMLSPVVGLNLRMTEVTAAIALVQLKKAKQIVSERVEIAEALTEQVKGIPGITPPAVCPGCTHSYYVWAVKTTLNRTKLVRALNAEGFPIREGYVQPLYRLPAFSRFERSCPVAERMHDIELMTYENCGYTPSANQIKQIGEAFRKVVEAIQDDRPEEGQR